MNQTDDLKTLRLQEEKRFLNIDFIEELSRQLIDELVQWANREIFAPRGGVLTFDITLGAPNAGVAVCADRPFHPRMEFRSSLISDIYADAFTFPIICRRFAQETETFNRVNETEQFRDCRVLFDSPLPELHESNVVELFRPICESIIKKTAKVCDDNQKLQADDVRCRFIMFELMLVWTFFHELGHVVQGHHRMHSKYSSLIGDAGFFEMDDAAPTHSNYSDISKATSVPRMTIASDLSAQARELMADAEAIDQTLKYLVMRRRLNFSVWYLLLCSTGCMFQRFYAGYPANLELSHGRHPHPAIRDEVSQLLGINLISDYLVASKNVPNQNETKLPLTYLSCRASLATGLFRSHRIEKRNNPDHLPSYMQLIQNGVAQQHRYIKALLPEIEQQLPMVLKYHLIETHSLEYWFEHLKAAANTAG